MPVSKIDMRSGNAETDSTPVPGKRKSNTTAAKTKRAKTGGRKKGSVNKLNATCKENIVAVFVKLGGTEAMKKWASANETEFYRIYSKLLPVEVSGPNGSAIQLETTQRNAMRDSILAAAQASTEK